MRIRDNIATFICMLVLNTVGSRRLRTNFIEVMEAGLEARDAPVEAPTLNAEWATAAQRDAATR